MKYFSFLFFFSQNKYFAAEKPSMYSKYGLAGNVC